MYADRRQPNLLPTKDYQMMQTVIKARYAYVNHGNVMHLARWLVMQAWLTCGKMQVDPEDVSSQPTVASETRFAQHEAEEDAVVKTRGTYDYLLKTDPSVSARVLSIVEVKRK